MIVTGIVTLWPGWTTYGANVALASVLPSHRSPVGAVTVESKAAVVAVIDAVPTTFSGWFTPNGPRRDGVMPQ